MAIDWSNMPVISGKVKTDMPIISGNVEHTPEVGYTPQKGIDYWTDSDKTEMVNDMADMLGLKVVDGKLNAVYGGSEEE